MRKKIVWFLVIITIFSGSLLLLNPQPAISEETLEELRAQLENNAAIREEAQQNIINQTQNINQLQTEIAELDAQLNTLIAEMELIEAAIIELEQQIADAAIAIADAQIRLEERQTYLEGRLRSIYMNGDIDMMDVFFEASSFEEFLSLYDRVESLLVQDREAMDQIAEEKAFIEAEMAKMIQAEADHQVVLAEQEIRKTELDTVSAEKSAAIAAAENDIATSLSVQAEMDAADAMAQDKIREIMEAQAASGTARLDFGGFLVWPLPANETDITSEYGMRVHPIYGDMRIHAGVDVGAPNGVEIYAAAPGEVIYCDWMGGYGNAVMIDHGNDEFGNGIVTLYAHMSAFSVFRTGDYVQAYDLIGYVGTTGQSTGNHLHFEVRSNGSHTDPWPYLGGRP